MRARDAVLVGERSCLRASLLTAISFAVRAFEFSLFTSVSFNSPSAATVSENVSLLNVRFLDRFFSPNRLIEVALVKLPKLLSPRVYESEGDFS